MGYLPRKLVSSLVRSFPSPFTQVKDRDRSQPVGYKVSLIDFADGEPVAASTSTTSCIDVFTNADNTKCPGACFRPVGMTFDSQGRLFVSSDASGEIYVIAQNI